MWRAKVSDSQTINNFINFHRPLSPGPCQPCTGCYFSCRGPVTLSLREGRNWQNVLLSTFCRSSPGFGLCSHWLSDISSVNLITEPGAIQSGYPPVKLSFTHDWYYKWQLAINSIVKTVHRVCNISFRQITQHWWRFCLNIRSTYKYHFRFLDSLTARYKQSHRVLISNN